MKGAKVFSDVGASSWSKSFELRQTGWSRCYGTHGHFLSYL